MVSPFRLTCSRMTCSDILYLRESSFPASLIYTLYLVCRNAFHRVVAQSLIVIDFWIGGCKVFPPGLGSMGLSTHTLSSSILQVSTYHDSCKPQLALLLGLWPNMMPCIKITINTANNEDVTENLTQSKFKPLSHMKQPPHISRIRYHRQYGTMYFAPGGHAYNMHLHLHVRLLFQ